MKKILAIAALLLGFVSAYAQNGKSIYMKYSDAENVSAVYVSPAMFRLIGKIPEIQANNGEVDLTPVIRGLSGLYIINSENLGINDSLYKDVSRFIDSGKYEMLMEVKDNGEIMHMYTCGDEKVVTSFVMLAKDGDELTFICLDGKLDRAQLEDLMASQMQ
jgi:hypothetical protein